MEFPVLRFKIITQERVVYDDEILQATIPTQDGEITVLPRHTPLVSILEAGELVIKKKDGEQHMAVSSGFIEVRPDSELIVLADSAERAEEIDVERAEAARQRAEDMLKEKQTVENVEFVALQASLQKEMARVKVGKRFRDVGRQL